MNVFFDTNVILDVLLEREPFLTHSRRAWHLTEHGEIRGIVSALTFANAHYIVRGLRGEEIATAGMRLMRNIVEVVPLDAQILNQAIDAGFKDFEDAIQYFSAQRANADFLLTRDADHFPRTGLKVMTPSDFLAARPF